MTSPYNYFVLEGGEAAGKTTQLIHLQTALEHAGHHVQIVREPGETTLGRELRRLITSQDYASTIRPLTSLYMLSAARHQMMEEIVQPAIAAGKIILGDRSFMSSMVYQSYIEGLDHAMTKAMCLQAIKNIVPSKIFLIDLPTEEAMRRLRAAENEKVSRYDVQGAEFHERVRRGYLAQIDHFPELIEKINGEQSVEAITQMLLTRIEDMLSSN